MNSIKIFFRYKIRCDRRSPTLHCNTYVFICIIPFSFSKTVLSRPLSHIYNNISHDKINLVFSGQLLISLYMFKIFAFKRVVQDFVKHLFQFQLKKIPLSKAEPKVGLTAFSHVILSRYAKTSAIILILFFMTLLPFETCLKQTNKKIENSNTQKHTEKHKLLYCQHGIRLLLLIGFASWAYLYSTSLPLVLAPFFIQLHIFQCNIAQL